MKKLSTKNGLIAYRATAAEIKRAFGSPGVCDECGMKKDDGYLIPVLNHWQCPECFEEWAVFAKHYPENDPVEAANAAFYENVIPLTE